MIKCAKFHILSWLRLLLFILADFAAIVYFRSYLTFMILLLLAAAPLCSLAVSWSSLKNILLYPDKKAVQTARDTPFRFVLRFQNPGIFPLSKISVTLKEENTFTGQKQVHRQVKAVRHKRGLFRRRRSFKIISRDYTQRFFILMPGKSTSLFYTPDFHTCGIAALTIDSLLLTDYFGLITLKRTMTVKRQVIILPKVLPAEESAPGFFAQNKETQRKVVQGQMEFQPDISQIREYIPGDRLNQIHWKLSAKKGSCMVKEYRINNERNTVIGIELYNNDENIINQILDKAYSLACFYISSHLEPVLVWWDSTEKKQIFRCPKNTEELSDCFFELMGTKTYSQHQLLKNILSENIILINEKGEYEFDYQTD